MNVKDGHMRAALTRRVGANVSRRSTRRAFLLAAAAWPALVWANALFAQSKPAQVVIGFLANGSREVNGPYLAAFKEGLAALGWKEGSQVVIEDRWASGQNERFPSLAADLSAKKPAVIVAATILAAAAASKAAPGIPIVVAAGGDPVAAGLVKSFARPGGLITGLTNLRHDLSEKYLELLLAAAPKLTRVGFLSDPRSPDFSAYMDAARRSVARHSVEARFAETVTPEGIDPAVSRLAKEGAQALIVLTGGGLFAAERQRIVKLALAQRWPVIAGAREFVEEGALLSYGIDTSGNFRRAAYYVDRILKGTKPGDLPIEQPMKFELVINMKTAKALKLEISRELAVRADRVIE
jgi:putative ABC transport system substrate-binding protein